MGKGHKTTELLIISGRKKVGLFSPGESKPQGAPMAAFTSQEACHVPEEDDVNMEAERKDWAVMGRSVGLLLKKVL